MELRGYQDDIDAALRDALRQYSRVIVVAPTGSGKGHLASYWVLNSVRKGRRAGMVTNRQILVRQLANSCKRYGIDYGILMGSEPRNDYAPVQICSVATLRTRRWKDMPVVDWWLVDESHQEPSAYMELMRLFPETIFVGLTATPVGREGKSLVSPHLFQTVIEPVKNTELIKDKWLLPTTVFAPSEPNIQGVRIRAGEYAPGDLTKAVEACTVFTDIFKSWEPYQDRQTILFAPLVSYARGLCQQFQERGFAAETIVADTKHRDQILAGFNSGEIRVLCSVDVLREGFDAPVASCGIDLQPNQQLRTYWQKLGRIKRPYPGQDRAIWLDLAGNVWRFPHPDENPEWPDWTTGETTQDILQRQRDKNEKQPWSCPLCHYTLSPWEKVRDGRCPNCGADIRQAVRRVRMGDGKVKEISPRQKKKTLSDADAKTWLSCLYPAMYMNQTMKFARLMYYRKTGRWPDHNKLVTADGERLCPVGYESIHWSRTVREWMPERWERLKARRDAAECRKEQNVAPDTEPTDNQRLLLQ